MSKNMTKGNPLKLLISFAIPLFIGNLFQQFYNMADTIIVGQTVSWQALAAVGATGPFHFLVFGFFFGLSGGLTILTSQYFGANNMPLVKKSIATSFIISGVITFVCTFLCLLNIRNLLNMVNVPESIFSDSYSYLFVTFLGMCSIVFYNLISSILRALGDSKTPLFFLIFACILNVALDFLFILAFGWGVSGIAWATVISQLCAGLWCLMFALKKFPVLHLRKADWKIDYSLMYKHLKLGIPTAFQLSVTAIGVIIFQAELNKFGDIAVGAVTIACRLEQLAIQVLFSMGISLTTFVAMNYGAKKFYRIKVATRVTMIIGMITSLVLGFTLIQAAPTLTNIFVSKEQMLATPELLENVKLYLKCSAPFYFTILLIVVYRGTLQGMGYALVPFLGGILELSVRALCSKMFGNLWGFSGLCFIGPLTWFANCIFMYIVCQKKIKKMTEKYL